MRRGRSTHATSETRDSTVCFWPLEYLDVAQQCAQPMFFRPNPITEHPNLKPKSNLFVATDPRNGLDSAVNLARCVFWCKCDCGWPILRRISNVSPKCNSNCRPRNADCCMVCRPRTHESDQVCGVFLNTQRSLGFPSDLVEFSNTYSD